MKTESLLIQTLCVPCACRCRYCLLSWDGRTTGASYDRSQRYAQAFYDWLRAHRPEIAFHFSLGYSMDHPRLPQAIDFMRATGSVGSTYLQMDGLRLRDQAETDRWLAEVAQHGIKELHFTFYGLQAYHDAFAGREGDFDYLLRLAAASQQQGLDISAGISLTHESTPQVDALLKQLQNIGFTRLWLFVPHEEGRGVCLNEIRFSSKDWALLSPQAQALLNRRIYRTEGEWVQTGDFAPTEKRMLLLTLTPDNIGTFENMGFDDALAYLEGLDDAYYALVPPLADLAARYGDADSPLFYRQRDLYHHYQKRYLAENDLHVYDVTDERQCGSRRY